MQKIRIGIVGLHQSGKSLLINCLLKRNISRVGTGCATTHTSVYYLFSEDEFAEYFDSSGCHEISPEEVAKYDNNDSIERINVYLNNVLLKSFTLIDLPGTGFNSTDNLTMSQALANLDYAILLATNVKEYTNASSFYANTLGLLQKYSVPYYFILNCTKVNNWSPNNKKNIELAESDMELLQVYEPLQLGEDGDKPLINLMWYWCSIANEEDELYLKYIGNISTDFDRRRKEFNRLALKEASRFYIIDYIFSKENRRQLEFKKELKQEISKIKKELCPVGTIQAFAFENEQEGWLFCDGRQLDIEDYPELFNTIGFTFGGDNYTKFQLPDLRGRFIRGWDNVGIIDKKRNLGSYQDDSLQEHSHQFEIDSRNTANGGHHTHDLYTEYLKVNGWGNTGVSYVNDGYTSNSKYTKKKVCEGGYHSHELPQMCVKNVQNCRADCETRPQNIALLYCIKAKNSNGIILKNAPHSEVELKKLFVSADELQYEGFALLTSEFTLKLNGNILTDTIFVEKLDVNSNNGKAIQLYQTNTSYNLKNQEKGLFYIKYEYTEGRQNETNIAKLTLIKIESIGIIGDFNGWKESIEMKPDDSMLLYTCTLKMIRGTKFKFRANNNWGIELDGDLKNLSPHKSKDLICDKSGEYEIILDIRSLPWHCEFKKKKSLNTVKSHSKDSFIEPSSPELDIKNILRRFNLKF